MTANMSAPGSGGSTETRLTVGQQTLHFELLQWPERLTERLEHVYRAVFTYVWMAGSTRPGLSSPRCRLSCQPDSSLLRSRYFSSLFSPPPIFRATRYSKPCLRCRRSVTSSGLRDFLPASCLLNETALPLTAWSRHHRRACHVSLPVWRHSASSTRHIDTRGCVSLVTSIVKHHRCVS